MRMQVQMRSQKEWVLPQRELRMPAKKAGIAEETQDDRPQQRLPDAERYLLQIDRQTKRSFKTPEAARSMALEIKARFPALQVSIYDNVTKSRSAVEVPKSS